MNIRQKMLKSKEKIEGSRTFFRDNQASIWKKNSINSFSSLKNAWLTPNLSLDFNSPLSDRLFHLEIREGKEDEANLEKPGLARASIDFGGGNFENRQGRSDSKFEALPFRPQNFFFP